MKAATILYSDLKKAAKIFLF